MAPRMEGKGSSTWSCPRAVVAAVAAAHGGGQRGTRSDMLAEALPCSLLRRGVQAAAGQGWWSLAQGQAPTAGETQNQHWPLEVHPSGKGGIPSRCMSSALHRSAPWLSPTAARAAKAREETRVPMDEVLGGQQLNSTSRSLPALSQHLKC